METSLTDNNALIEQVAWQLNQVYFIYDVGTGAFRYLSPAFSSLWGMEAECILDDPALLLGSIHEEDLGFVMSQYRKVQEGHCQHQVEFRIWQPDKSLKWICLSGCVPQQGSHHQVLIGGFAA